MDQTNAVPAIRDKGVKAVNVRKSVVTVTLIAGVLVIFFNVCHTELQKTFGTEVFKLNYQFLLITVIGGLIAALYTQFNKEQETRLAERKAREHLRQQLYDNCVRAVNQILRLRFLIGARAVKSGTVVQKPYDKLMGEFLDVMLELASMKNNVESSPPSLYGSAREALINDLQLIVSYLNDIIIEYDSSPELFDPNTHNCPRSKLQVLEEFLQLGYLGTETYNTSNFKTRFLDPERRLRSEVQRLLLKTE